MEETSWLDLDELRVVRAFVRSSRALFATFDRELQQAVGLPRSYFEILWLLAHAPDRSMRMSDLAEATDSQPSRISHAVGRLERAGQVRRELCAEDRRGFFAVATEEGLAVLERARPHYAQIIRRHLLEPLTSIEKAQLIDIGETLIGALSAERAVAELEVAAP